MDVLAPNTRVGQIKRYLAKPPASAVKLVMAAAAESGATPITLGEWPMMEVVPALALEICAGLDEHCRELNASVKAVLQYQDESGKPVGAAKILTRSPQHIEADDGGSAASLAQSLTGDATSLVVQSQRHTEAMVRMLLTSMGGQLHTMQRTMEHTMELCEQLATRLAESEGRESRERRERERAEHEASELAQALHEIQAAEPKEDGTTAAQDKILQLLQPFLMKALMNMNQPTPGKPG